MMDSRRGYIFIEALIVVTLLVSLMAILAANERASIQDVQNRLGQRRADAAVDAGIARALGTLQGANSNIVTLNDDLALLGSNGDEEFDLGNDASFRIQMVDTNSLLDLNYITLAQLQDLPLDPDQVDCLLDWRETSTNPRSDGAKDSYYNALDTPYNTKLGPLTTVDELLLIKNWTGETIYQAPTEASTVTMPTGLSGDTLPLASLFTVDSGAPNLQASGAARINFARGGLSARQLQFYGISRGQANLLASNTGQQGRPGGPPPAPGQGVTPPYTSFSQLLGVRGLNNTTIQTLLNIATFSTSTRVQGKLNINTATTTALSTLPAMSTGVSEAIVQQQTNGFQTLGQLATVPGATPPLIAILADNFTIGSDTWIVRVYGQSGGATSAVEAVVGLRNSLPQVITYTKLHTVGIPTWWNWNAQTTTSGDAGSLQ